MIKQLLLSFLAGGIGIASAQYCVPDYTSGTIDDDYIDGVELNTISNLDNGPGDGSGYTDYTALSTDLTIGYTYDIYLENTLYYTEYYRIYIDYDHDEVFSSTEEITPLFTMPAGTNTTKTFTVPFDALPGPTRMRVRCVYGATAFDACNTQTFGEAEDYTVNLLAITDDISVSAIYEIADACELSDDAVVTIDVTNFGTLPAGGFSVNLQVDGGAVSTESYPGGILPGITETFTFAAGADLSADGLHTIRAWTEYDADMNATNDTSEITVENTSTYLTTGFPSNICYDGGTILPSPIAGGGTWSGDGIIDPTTGELDPTLVGGIGSSTDITYAFTSLDAYTVTQIPYEPHFKVDPTELALGDDATANAINIGFSFTFFGNTYTNLFISSNGLVGFSAPSNSYSPQNFPSATYPNNIIAWCWTDLNPGAGGTVSYETTGVAPNRQFIVYYDDVLHYGGDDQVSGQIVLHETSNAIDLIAIDIQSDGGSMTQGIENIDGTAAFYADDAYNLEVFSMSETSWRYAVTPCSGTVTETINFIAPPAVEIADANVCTGTTVTLDAGPDAEYYVWNTGATTQSIDVTTSGTYVVTYFANPTCYVTDTATVVVNPLPAVDLGTDGIACEGTMLDAENPGSEYTWSTGATTQTLFITESGTYSVTVYNPVTTCENADTITMTITPLPIAAFDALPTAALTVVFTSLAADAETWFWDFGDGTTSTEENPWHTYPFAGDFTVTLVVTNGCGADIASSILTATTDIADASHDALNIYPNPVSDILNIAGVQSNSGMYRIADVTGRLVMEGMYAQGIPVAQLAAGMYTLTYAEDALEYVTRFVKQ